MGRRAEDDGAGRPSSAQLLAERTDRETIYHPAVTSPASRGVAAGRVIVIVVVALVVAGLLNSAWMVRTAEGMPPGMGRGIVTAVAVPFDTVATALALDRPRQGIDAALGREQVAEGSDEIEAGIGAAPAPAPVPNPSRSADDGAVAAAPTPTAPPEDRVAPATVAAPTTDAPVRILVIGDSLSTYTGMQLQNRVATKELATVEVRYRNGVGLASPKYFNWAEWALQQVDEVQPDAVHVVLGGNDNLDMERKGTYFSAGTDEWRAEYQRRVEVVMQAMINRGVDRVYWSGPPTSRDPTENTLFRQLNEAIFAATDQVKGTRFVDLAGPTSKEGQWVDVLVRGDDAFQARMGDGFHWSWKASMVTAELVATSMAQDYGKLI